DIGPLDDKRVPPDLIRGVGIEQGEGAGDHESPRALRRRVARQPHVVPGHDEGVPDDFYRVGAEDLDPVPGGDDSVLPKLCDFYAVGGRGGAIDVEGGGRGAAAPRALDKGALDRVPRSVGSDPDSRRLLDARGLEGPVHQDPAALAPGIRLPVAPNG